MKTALVLIQAATFVPLAYLLFVEGSWRLAGAQLLLAGVTALVYF